MSDTKHTPTIGLEIHAELATSSKMFCGCANATEEVKPNVHVCPVCMAHPGTLPVINKKAVESVLRVGVAIGGTPANFSEFDRKSYFYPDIPKGYQISQYKFPLIAGGLLAGVPVTRIHLEEDTARSSHAGGTSLVDFNRAGVPLMELVTEPHMHDAQTAGNFARELQLLLRTLGASHANLEKGEMRIEANVSVSKDATPSKNYVEVKNINSFRAVERAIEFEIARQTKLLEEGGTVVKETRGWDENKQVTFSQRVKEGAADYRYFPEPDLPKLQLHEIPEFSVDALKATLPELPWERRGRYEALGIKAGDAAYLGASFRRAEFFDTVSTALENTEATILAANYLVSDVAGWYTKNLKDGEEEFTNISSESFVALIRMIVAGALSSRGAKDVLAMMFEGKGKDPQALAQEAGLMQESDPEVLRPLIQEALTEHPGVVAEFKAGKESVLQFLVGMVIKATKGSGNPTVIREVMLEEIAKA